jgi:hypothetical protein
LARGSSCDDIHKKEDSMYQSCFTVKSTKGEFLGTSLAINTLKKDFLESKHTFPISWTLLAYCIMKQLPALLHLARYLVKTKKEQFQQWCSQGLTASWPWLMF